MHQSLDFSGEMDKIYKQDHLDQMIQGERLAAGKDNTLTSIIRNGRIIHLHDYKNTENHYATIGNPGKNVDLANQTMYQFEKDFRKQMFGKKMIGRQPKTPGAMNFSNQPISENYDIQKNFERYSKMPILDQTAEAILRNNTRRKDGISDIPKAYGEALKAAPGYGLPNI